MMEDPGLYDPKHESESKLFAAKVVFLELAKIIVLVVVIILVVRYFLFRPFDVKGQSMEPSFSESEYLIIDEITYRLGEPKRGDVVVFRHNGDARDFFLKRIIGLPGEKVKIQGGKVVVYNTEHPQGVVIDEDYLSDMTYTQGELVHTMGEDEYFVMGDNRGVSFDSRKFGSIKRKDIVGRVWLRGWPIDKFGRPERPIYDNL